MQPLIKYTGSKRYMLDIIAGLLPDSINTFYDPFTGGASIVPVAVKVAKNVVASDISSDVISFWCRFQQEPELLKQVYKLHHQALTSLGQSYYYEVRDRFNETRQPYDFHFLTRTCVNGLIRYNKSDEFNVSFHHNRNGMKPERMNRIIDAWKPVVDSVTFINADYRFVMWGVNESDFVFLDPPYSSQSGMYQFDEFDHNKLWDFIRSLNEKNVRWLMIFDSDKYQSVVPGDIYQSVHHSNSSNSSFGRIVSSANNQNIKERIYTNY